MYTLYYSEGACSMTVHVTLHELGVPFELEHISIKAGRNRAPDFLAINPRGSVPVLKEGELLLRESAAILIYLLDKHAHPLLPAEGAARAKALEWLMTAESTLHPLYSRILFLKREARGEAGQTLTDATLNRINEIWDEVEAQLGKTAYIAGEECTIADIFLSVIANWQGFLPQPVLFGPNTRRMLTAVIHRPSYQKALREENITYKAVA